VRVIIPAAGLGTRLRPYTTQLPKCLVPVGGKPIIERLLGQLYDAGVTDVMCVAGHHADLLERRVAELHRRPPVKVIYNPDYARSNSIVSLLSTAPFWDQDVAVIDSDILVSARLIRLLLEARGDVMIIDPGKPRAEIDMAIEVRDGVVWHLDKQLPPERTSGEFFGLSRWTTAGGQQLAEIMSEMVSAGARDVWYQFAIRELAKRLRIMPLHARSDEWIEVDSLDDLAVAEAAHRAGAAWA
jgi:L-glutamine-phosphate cytidylyltransferase